MHTGDDQHVAGWMRVWAGASGPGSVDPVASRANRMPAGWIVVRLDTGRSMVFDAEDLRIHHPADGTRPPLLPVCLWLVSCEEPAVRMQPHSLMSPVPVCAHHIAEFDLP